MNEWQPVFAGIPGNRWCYILWFCVLQFEQQHCLKYSPSYQSLWFRLCVCVCVCVCVCMCVCVCVCVCVFECVIHQHGLVIEWWAWRERGHSICHQAAIQMTHDTLPYNAHTCTCACTRTHTHTQNQLNHLHMHAPVGEIKMTLLVKEHPLSVQKKLAFSNHTSLFNPKKVIITATWVTPQISHIKISVYPKF